MTDAARAGEAPLTARLASNTLVQAVGTLLASAIAFFTFVAATRGLGPAAYGEYAASLVVIFVSVVLVDIGLSTAVVREISAAPERTEAVMRTSLSLRAALSVVIVGAIVAIGLFAPLSEQTRTGVLIGAVGAVAIMMTAGLTPVLQAQLRMHWAVVANLAGRLVTLGLTLGALAFDYGFVGVVWANVAGLLVTLLVNLAVVSRIVSLRPEFDLGAWRALIGGSAALAVALGLGQVYFRIDTLLLALLRPEREVGLYSAAYKFLELSGTAVAAVSVTVLPPLSRFIATNDPRLRRLITKTFDVMIAIGLPLALILALFAEEIVSLTSGAQYADAASVLRVLALYTPMMFVGALLWNILIASGRDRLLLGLAAAVLVLNVVANVALLPHYGYQAAAYVAVASEALLLVAVAVAIRAREGFLPGLGYFRVLGPALAVMAAVIVFLPGPWLLAAAVASAAYVAIVAVAPGAVREVIEQILRIRVRRTIA